VPLGSNSTGAPGTNAGGLSVRDKKPVHKHPNRWLKYTSNIRWLARSDARLI
jgi:hypothetical protein